MAMLGSDFDFMKWNTAFRSGSILPFDPAVRRSGKVINFARAAAWIVMVFGVLEMMAWIFNIPILTSLAPGFVSVKFNTSLCLFGLGAALCLQSFSERLSWKIYASHALCSAVFFITFLTLSQYLLGIDLGIDQLFVPDVLNPVLTSSPGRMASTTALTLMLQSIALFAPQSSRIRISLSLVGAAIAYLNICGYVFDVSPLYSYFRHTVMALPTALALTIICLGTVSLNPKHPTLQMILAETPAGFMLRRMLPSALILPFVLGWVRLAALRHGLDITGVSIAFFSVSYSVIFVVLIWRNALVIEKASIQKEVAEKQRDTAEQTALRQARRISSIMENISDAVITINDRGQIKTINQATMNLFGFKASELIGAKVDILLPNYLRSQDRESLIKRLSFQLSDRKFGFRRELEAKKKNGQLFPIDLAVSEFSIGEERYFTGVIRDITERKKSQEALRRWEYIFKNAQWAITVISPNNDTIMDVNPAFAEMHGYTVEEMIGLSLSVTVAPEERQRLPSLIARINEENELLYESVNTRKNGERFYVLIHVNTFRDDEGRIIFRAATCQDISARKEAEDNLRMLREDLEQLVQERTQRFADEVAERTRIQETLERKEAELLLIAHAIPAALVYIDRSERYVFCNKTFERWMGLSQEEIIGKTIGEMVDAAFYQTISPYLQNIFEGHAAYYEAKLPYRDKERDVAVNAVPDLDAQGRVRGFVLLSSDISSLMQAQTELKAAKILADDANRAKSAFLANMSHEIRTPLGAVIGFSELLTNPRLSPLERGNYVSAIKRNGEMLSNIINDILDISKVEAGRLAIATEQVVVSDLISDTMALLNLQASEKAIQLSVVAEGPIPYSIMTDPLRLKQILSNIAGNAIKFTEKGRVEIRIRQQHTESGPKLAFIISDTGPGITPEQAQRLFAPFSQADASTTRKFGGTGLGLALARRLAQLLGGEVELKSSQVGIGSTFSITIDPGSIETQLFVNYDPSVARNETALAVLPREVNLQGLEVLLAEDAPDNQMLITHYLRMAGARVEAANNGREACDMVQLKNYDVVLMDLQMPVMDGFEATAELRRSGYVKPILALTAHAMKEDRLRCLANGFDDHISKPIDGQLLIERVALLGQHTLGSHPH